jgi:hypothetical protein
MLLYIREDAFGFIYEPHGTEPEVWSTTPEGSAVLRDCGWRPYSMQRVSRFVHESLLIDGWLVKGVVKLSPVRSFTRKSDPSIR